MRIRFIALCLALFCTATTATAATNVSVSIGINVPAYPQMTVVPGYPVYYAPGLPANYFFYDGMYWVLAGDEWYMSSWYNGPWVLVSPAAVPYYVLRVPVRYYRAPPPWFRGWARAAPPHWGQHWGPQWEQQHRDWDRWNRRSVPAPAPLPSYQSRYAGPRYPAPPQQAALQSNHYRYQPRTEVAREHVRQTRAEAAPRVEQRQVPPPPRQHAQQAMPQGAAPTPHEGRPAPQRGHEPPPPPQHAQVPPGAAQPPGPPGAQGRGGPPEQHGRGRGHERGEEGGQGQHKGGKD